MHAATSQSASSASSTSQSRADSLTLIYSPFGPENVTEAAAYVRDTGQIYVGYDWGFTDPTHIGLYQYRDAALYQFDELVGSGRSEASWVEEIVARITALPAMMGPLSMGGAGTGPTNNIGPVPGRTPGLMPPPATPPPSSFASSSMNEASAPEILNTCAMPSPQARTCSEPSSSRATTGAVFSSIPGAPVRWRPLRTTAPPSWRRASTTRSQTQTPPTTHLVTAPTRRATSAGFSGGCLAWPVMRGKLLAASQD